MILHQIAALPCRQPSKPLFAFEFSMEAANKNFILLTRKFGGDLLKALLAQSDSPLGYGSEFKPIETLELIFRIHPSWSRMKQVLGHESKWPLQPLDEDDRIKDVKEALLFGNHKGAVKQQDLLVKLVTDDTEHEKHRVRLFGRSVHEIEDLRSDQMEALRASLRVERFPLDLT
jgi:hypothetical protein